jgi:hypothetical protein
VHFVDTGSLRIGHTERLLRETRSNPSSLEASKYYHGVTVFTRYAKAVEDARVSGDRSRHILPATEIIGGTRRQVLDCLDALLAQRHEHQRGKSRDVFEFVGMGLEQLTKNEKAMEELAKKGMA